MSKHIQSKAPVGAEDVAAGDAASPETYPRRILVVVTGMSPQVVTETTYALAVAGSPAFVPTEVILVTTQRGMELAASKLLDAGDGWFHRLRSDYGLRSIEFDAEHIHVLKDATGAYLGDIRTPADNTAAADAITQLLCELTKDERSALHVSIAGGRKTMGFYTGYALSVYGRRQDRLSHVLVSPASYESKDFFYPTRESMIIDTPDGPIDARDGKVSLAEIPFVRLREGLPDGLLEGEIRYHDAVDAVQRVVAPVDLVLDLRANRIRAGGHIVSLPPTQLAFLAWLAMRQKEGLGWLPCPIAPEPDYAAAYLDAYKAVIGPMGASERTEERLTVQEERKDGNGDPPRPPRRYAAMDSEFFSQTKAKLHRSLNRALGKPRAAAYLVSRRKERRGRVYGLAIPAAAISFAKVKAQ